MSCPLKIFINYALHVLFLILYIRLHENIPLPPYCKMIFWDFFGIFHDEIKYINANEAIRLIINITLVIKKNDINYSRYLAIRIKIVRSRPLLDRSRPTVGRGFLWFFLNFSCAHKHSCQSSYKNYGKTRKTKGIYRKTRKPLRGERSQFILN